MGIRHIGIKGLIQKVNEPMAIEPLITLRIVLGVMLFISTARFLLLGWVEDHYIAPKMHFAFYGFEWLPVLSPFFLYTIHLLMMLAALGVVFGLFFRLSSILLFLLFSYTELIDLTYYLNHYYFVSIALFFLIFTPAHKAFSFDARRQLSQEIKQIPRFWIFIFQVLLALVYIYAGVAKINYDWLIEALPLKIWLPAQDKLPLIGPFFAWKFAPYIFSWVGMLYDCTIVFWLLNSRTRPMAYLMVIAFHVMTGMLFQIGVFPMVMVGATLIFFSEKWHIRLLDQLKRVFRYTPADNISSYRPVSKPVLTFFLLFFIFQIIFPWRYVLFPGNLFWTEEGYRFSWRVMLMEKAGTATFFIKDGENGREGIVVNSDFLNAHQEKQMAMQPDMILQFAHYLKAHYLEKGMSDPHVRAEVYVTLNARPSALLIDPQVNLTALDEGWKSKTWINPAPK